MAKHYTTAQFFRQTSAGLLKAYFKRKNVLSDFDFDRMLDGNIDDLFDAWLG